MQIDQKWVERNLGFDPILMPPPASTFAFSRAARTSDPEDLQREIIDFDSSSPAGLEFLAFTQHAVSTPANWMQGGDVLIAQSVTDEQARLKFPGGWKAPRPYLRIVPQPR